MNAETMRHLLRRRHRVALRLPSNARLTAALGFLAASNVVTALFYQWYVITTLGAGFQTDALFASMTVPQLVLAVLTHSLSPALIPYLANESGEALRRVSWSVAQGITLIFAAVAIVIGATSTFWLRWTVPGFNANTLLLTQELLRIQLVGTTLSASTAVLWAVSQARQRFVWAESTPIVATVAGLLFVVWGLPRLGIVAVAWALVLKGGVQTLLLLPILGAYRRPTWVGDELPDLWQQVRPLIFKNLFARTDELLERFLLSSATPGMLTLLDLARRLYGAVVQVLGAAIVSPVLPQLAVLAHASDWVAFRRLSRRRLWIVTSMATLGVVFLVAAGLPALHVVFSRRNFASADVHTLWLILLALSGLMIGGPAGSMLASTFYAMRDMKTPTRIAIIGFVVGAVFKVGGYLSAGVIGLALATTCYYSLNGLALHVLLERSLTDDPTRQPRPQTHCATY